MYTKYTMEKKKNAQHTVQRLIQETRVKLVFKCLGPAHSDKHQELTSIMAFFCDFNNRFLYTKVHLMSAVGWADLFGDRQLCKICDVIPRICSPAGRTCSCIPREGSYGVVAVSVTLLALPYETMALSNYHTRVIK